MQAADDPILLNVKSLGCVRSDRQLFADLSFSVNAGQAAVIEGRNGSGKTSLLRILAGLSEPEDGEVWWRGENIYKEREAYIRELLYFGHLPAVKGELTAGENLRLSTVLCGESKLDAASALQEVDLKGFEDMPTHYLSAGQKRRVALSRLYCSSATLWILDEPLTAIDVHGVAKIEKTIGEHVKRGGSVIMTTHQSITIPGVEIKKIRLGATKSSPTHA